MTKYIVIASGKGGVGKTTAVINIGKALVDFGRDVVVVDANFSKPNIGLHLGSSSLPGTLHDALNRDKNIREVIYMHPSGLKVIPGSIAFKDLESLEIEHLSEVLHELDGLTELVIIDAAPGIHKEAIEALRAADELLIVVQPNMLSITDALKTIKAAERVGTKVIGIIVNRLNHEIAHLSNKSIESILEKKIIGEIPDDNNIAHSLKLRHPVLYSHPETPSAVYFKKLAAFLIGEKYEAPLKEESRVSGFLKKVGIKE